MIPPNVLAGAWQARSNANEQSTKKGPPKAGTRGLLVGLVLGFTNSSLHRPRKFLDYPSGGGGHGRHCRFSWRQSNCTPALLITSFVYPISDAIRQLSRNNNLSRFVQH
jgi:hypothetical protein